VLFGSDYPLRPISEAVLGVSKYSFSDVERRAIERENALRLVPRLKS
jgi:predicted TIM-barrel fold metal-dependent hydrolase